MAQEATNWDRFFNSTISLPQQFVWRVQRAMQEDDIDLFSEKGILDASLIPILGMLDDHKNDVMPDYMFGDNLGNQIGGSILYDPLTYMSGGLSALGKLAQLSNKVRTVPMISRKMTKAFGKSGKAGKEADVPLGKMTLGQMDEMAAKALKKENRGQSTWRQRRELKAFRKELGKQGDAMYGETLEGILKHEGDRQLAWRVPILWRAGAKINVAPEHQNWFRFWGDQKNSLSTFVKAKTTAHLAPLTGAVGKLPFAREAVSRFGNAFKFLNAPGHINSLSRAWGRGWAVGGDAAYAPKLQLNDAQLSEQSAFLSTENSLLQERIKEFGAKTFNKMYAKLIKAENVKNKTKGAAMDPMRAFVRTFGGKKPGSYRNAPKNKEQYEHLAKRLFGKMVGESDVTQWGDETLELFDNTFKSGRQNAIDNVAQLTDDYITKTEDAWKSLYGNLAHSKRTKAGEALVAHVKESPRWNATQKLEKWEAKLESARASKGKGKHAKVAEARKQVSKYRKEADSFDWWGGRFGDSVKDFAFKAGKKTATIQGKMWHADTGLRDLINAEKVLRQHENMGADQARAIGELLYKSMKVAAKQEGMKPEPYLKFMGNLFEGVIHPDEVIETFRRTTMTAEDRLRALDSVNRFLNKHMSALEAMGGMAQKGSLTRNSLGRLQRNLESTLATAVPKSDEDYLVRLIKESSDDAAENVKRVLPDEMLKGKHSDANMHYINHGGVRGELGVLDKAELEKARQAVIAKGTRAWTGKEYRQWIKNTPKGKYIAKFKKRFKLSDEDLAKAVALPTDGIWTGPNQIRKINGKSIDGDALKRLKKYLTNDEKAIVLKQKTRFKPEYLEEASKLEGKDYMKDLERMDAHAGLRGTGAVPNNGFKPSFDAPKQQPIPGEWAPPRGQEHTGRAAETVRAADNADVGPWADSYARSKVLQNELALWVEKNAKAINDPTTPLAVPTELFDDLMREVERTSDQLWNLVRNGHTKGGAGQEFMDLIRNYQGAILHQSLKSGLIRPGAPLGYIGRFLKGQERKALDDLMARADVRDVMDRLGIKLPSHFGRNIKADEMVVEELNDMYRTLNKSHTPEAKGIAAEIEEILTHGTGDKEFLKHWEEDPILRTVTRLSHASQNDTIEKFFDAAMDSSELISGKDIGQALAISGKVIGQFDDTGNKHIFKRRTIQVLKDKPTKRKGRGRASAEDIVSDISPGVPQRAEFETRRVGGIDSSIEQTMKGVIIEIEQGGKKRQIAVSNDQLKNGMGILSLGEANEYTKTTANAFVSAINRADLDKTFIRGQFRAEDLDELMGKHVVFGNESTVAGTVNMTRNLLDVTPKALRTLDTMNYAIKSWQTVFRVPFHIANMASGTMQAMMAGASPMDVMAGYYHAGRMLFKADTKWHRLHDRSISGLEMEGITPKEGLRLGRGEFVAAARRIGSGWLGDVDPKTIKDYGLDQVDDFLVPIAGGGSVSAGELLRLAATEGLYGTYAAAGMRGSQTISDTLLRVKADALDPEIVKAQGHPNFAKLITAKRAALNVLSGRPGEFGRALTEASEVWNRTGTVMALVRAGNSPRRAVQMAKMAHVPYEQVTSFEKNFLKRGIMYYTFPRHYVPFAWGKFMEDPKKLSTITNTIRQSTTLETESGDVGFTQFEGKPILKVGDYRIDVGRLNSNIEAALMFNSFLDNIAMPVARMIPGVGEAVDPRWVARQTTDMGLLSTGGLGSIIGAERQLLGSYPTRPDVNEAWTDKLLKATWPIKMMAQGLGKLPGKFGMPASSPYVQKTAMEKALTHSDLALPLRKVRQANEVQMARINYQKLQASLKARFISAKLDGDKREMELISENLQEVAEALKSLVERETTSSPDFLEIKSLGVKF